MRKFENYIKLESLDRSKDYLVPYIFTENYYTILRKRIKREKLTENEQYYFNHFIKKKLKGIIELMEIDTMIRGKAFIRKDRLNKGINLLKKYSRKHKNMKLLISGSFLYNKEFNDIDIFVISKYNKEDYKEEKIHINYLPITVENTLFFQSINAISISNFDLEFKVEEDNKLSDILHLYEVVILLIMQKDDCLQELRNLIIRLEYVSNRIVLNSMQLKLITDKIINSKNPIQVINKYLIAKIVNAYSSAVLRRTFNMFIEKNSSPEEEKIHNNWEIYNQTYKEAIEVVT